ncbi:probable LRR receptor-like serine/threonine-protein kinase At1g56130 [Ziziphus jujuba]|uniref:non-specific serine/threonine protein kinase n=1 Tax=Ziziphus jujuba TaxID=326968 RepID=A0ABM3IIU1_ZIZJJ|nr:probable LRR receptor-like serine/threonine-protein kinase At1g56130 [Ziziphus jujuba]
MFKSISSGHAEKSCTDSSSMERKTSTAFICTFYVAFIFGFVSLSTAQNQTQPITDPSEARALNSMFAKWNIKAKTGQWNISGELCSGAATDLTLITDRDHNPFIKCDCSYNDSTLCHIKQLKVYELNVAGPIPDELWTLTYLDDLNLNRNYLSGSLSPSIGNLTRLQYLTFGINKLSGEVPKEVGNLTDLLSFSIAGNNFSGPLPSEIGNLVNLQQLYIHSSGVSGEIPPTLVNLKNLVTFYASNTGLSGRIPDFIGNLSKLNTLRFEGCSLEGPIPSSLSNLTSLLELRINDLSNRSSSLEFVKNLKNLSVLVLRNSNISGSIPSDIGRFPKLTQLDLSFNNLRGHIPDSLFNMSSLSFLFLGSNQLTGSLPEIKSSTLLNIDVSYNYLEGSFPSWIKEPNLQLNLVANNFTIDGSNSSPLPSGLECLQRNFPCNRGRGLYYDFAIKCAGPQFTSSNGIVYEMDNATLGPATYFVSSTKRWAVSNVGLFTSNNNPQYKSSSSYQFTNTLDSELYQTARISPSSLRYYGLGLENGNYTVNLMFSETAFEDSQTWKSLGKREFDVYIQGKRVLENFNIREEAEGVASQAVQRGFKALVSENYLEIHLFWAGKGTCCIPAQGTYGPSISAISATPDFVPTVSNKPPSNENRTGLIVGIVVPVGVLSFLSLLVVFYIVTKRRKKSQTDDEEELFGIDVKPFTFSYEELKTATDDFNSTNKLGEGGFGPVYKGTLDDGRVIAAKQLSVTSHQGKNQFVTEIATISSVQHRNLVKLYGCCIEGNKRLLVYEYLENKSLDQALFGSRSLGLSWSTRYDICMGVARGLAYLHQESRLRIVHRDVKASNILLDSDLNPKISDFGLARLYDDKKTHISTRVAGTIGYLAPEYAMRGHLTEKTDVFAFGVVALEIVSGRANSDSSLEADKMYLLEWAWNLYEENRENELVDSSLSTFNKEEVKRIIGVALWCTQTSPSFRPSMSRVVAILSGDAEVSTELTRPGYLTDWKFEDLSSQMSDNATKGSNTSYNNSSASTSMVGDAEQSPVYGSTMPRLDSFIEEGR